MANPPARIRKSDRTRAAILEAARTQFARHGYEATTIRDVAAAASIDASMVMRYFGSKDALFARAAAIELHLPDLSKIERSALGEALIRHFLALWEGPGGNPGMTILLRAAATNDDAAEKAREVFSAQVAPALMKVGGGKDFPARAALVSPRSAFACSRRSFDASVGFVARRTRGTRAAASTSACSLRSASARLPSRVRIVCALMTTTPSAVMRASRRASSRAFTGSGSDDAAMSKRR